jgi:arginine utilization regulatory protein
MILKTDASIPHESILKTLLDSVKVGVLIINKSGVIIYYNKECSIIDGLKTEDVIGRNLLDVYPSLSTETSIMYQVMRTGKAIYNTTQHYTNFEGRLITTVNSTLPLYNDQQIWGSMEISQDVNLAWESYETILDLQAKLSLVPGVVAKSFKKATGFHTIVTSDSTMKKAINLGRKIAKMDCPLVVYGETGTGKELFIKAIHQESPRKNGPLISQNCAALPETLLEAALFGTTSGAFTGAQNRPGLFELADKGTLFLDEVMSAPIALQAKLLRVLEEMIIRRVGSTKSIKVDVRVVASINIKPDEAIKKGLLREDFFYRLAYTFFELIPLRQRKKDIPLLVKHFLEQHAEITGNRKEMTPEAVKRLSGHNWPGNVRELKNIIDKAASTSGEKIIDVEHLSLLRESSYIGLDYPWDNGWEDSLAEEGSGNASLQELVDSFERDVIANVLNKHGGNMAAAAKTLNTPRQTLWSKVKRLGLDNDHK